MQTDIEAALERSVLPLGILSILFGGGSTSNMCSLLISRYLIRTRSSADVPRSRARVCKHSSRSMFIKCRGDCGMNSIIPMARMTLESGTVPDPPASISASVKLHTPIRVIQWHDHAETTSAQPRHDATRKDKFLVDRTRLYNHPDTEHNHRNQHSQSLTASARYPFTSVPTHAASSRMDVSMPCLMPS